MRKPQPHTTHQYIVVRHGDLLVACRVEHVRNLHHAQVLVLVGLKGGERKEESNDGRGK